MILREPRVYLVGRQVMDFDGGVVDFLLDENLPLEMSAMTPFPEELVEMAGRLCYMSFGKGRGHQEYFDNILESGHGSVLEHAVWNFIFTGVSRSLTHELVRHRAGFGFSQLSQRYVDESDTAFIEPDIIAEDAYCHGLWTQTIEATQRAYSALVTVLAEKIEKKHPDSDKTTRRKMARGAARSVLPNATETKIFVTANARALRHFIELRGSQDAEVEIRKVAVQILRIMQKEAPSIFGDFSIVTLSDGTEGCVALHHKV